MCSFKFFLVFVVVKAVTAEVCPDVTALHNVSAHFNFQPEEETQHAEFINFYLLENQTIIHVERADVPVLCQGMVNNFRFLQSLALTNSNISNILPEAFKQVPKLTSLSLAVNHLVIIKKEQFRNLQKLRVLYLSSNEIENVEEDAFSYLPNLRKIYLDKNKIFEIDNRWFTYTPKITLINLAFNFISKLQAKAFTVEANSVLEIRLQHNIIQEIEPKAVVPKSTKEPKSHVKIRIDFNNVTKIPQGLISAMDTLDSEWSLNSNLLTCVDNEVLEELTTTRINLILKRNPFSCPCMQDLTNFMNENIIKGRFEYTSIRDCYLYGLQTPPEWNSL